MPPPATLDDAVSLPCRDPGPERSPIKTEFRSLVHRSLTRLPAIEHLALALYLTGISYQEVADCLGVRVTTVKERLFRARRRLVHHKEEAASD